MPKISEDYKKLFRKLNRVMNEWNNISLKPNDVRKAENQLEQFYDWMGKDIKNPYRFNLRVKYNQDQLDELQRIASSIVNDDIYFEDFNKKFKKARGKHGIQSLEQYIDFIEKKNRFNDMAFNSSALSYYQYERLLNRAQSAGLSQEQLDKRIYRYYKKTGFKKEKLYEYVYKRIKPKRGKR